MSRKKTVRSSHTTSPAAIVAEEVEQQAETNESDPTSESSQDLESHGTDVSDDIPDDNVDHAESVVEETDDTPDNEEVTEETTVERSARDIFDLPDAWTDEQVADWVAVETSSTQGPRNEQDVLHYDPTRQHRSAGKWSDDELDAWVRGELHGVDDDARQNELVTELRRRQELDPHWSDLDILNYARHGTEPRKTGSGIYVDDPTRPDKRAQAWTRAELDAWARGDISATHNASDVQLAAALKKTFDLNTASTTVDGILKVYNKDNDDDDTSLSGKPIETSELPYMAQSHIHGALQRYYEAVKPKQRISQDTGENAQKELDRLFQYVLRLEGPAMLAGLREIAEFVREHQNDVFSPDYAYRFVRALPGGKHASNNHVNLIELFLLTTDANKSRRHQMDLQQMVRHFPQDQQQRLLDFFTNYA